VGTQLKTRGEGVDEAIEELNAQIAEIKDDTAQAELQTRKGRLEEEKKLIETRATEFGKKLETLKKQEDEKRGTPDNGTENK
jgi:hypothetical protein